MSVAEFLATCEGKWSLAPPASPAALKTLAENCGLSLPTDYLEFLGLCNGGDGFLSVQPCYLRLWQAEEVIGNNLDYQMPEFVPGFFGFGDAGGGEFFAFDARAPVRWPVVSIPFVPMEEASAWAVADSFTDLLLHVSPPNDPSLYAQQVVAEDQVVFVVVAASDGEILATAGDLNHADFTHLLPTLTDGPFEVRRAYEFLDRMLLPQSSMQGDASVYMHKPREGLLVLTGVLLPRGDSSPELFAKTIHQTGQELDSVVRRLWGTE